MKATVLIGLLTAALLHAASPAPNGVPDATIETADTGVSEKVSGVGRIGMGVKMSTLGAGIEGAVAVAKRINIRGGYNDFRYEHSLTSSGIHYDGKLALRSATVNADFYVVGPLHLSPGVLLYNENRVTATASVPSGQTFTLGSVTYLSSQASPANGSASVGFNNNKVAPELLIGLGNLVPRSGRHFAVNFEVGAAYLGSPAAKLNLGGTVCSPSGAGCVNAATDPTVQSNVQAQQDKLNHNLRWAKYYPIVSLGLGYRF
jgi:hypothetical protein